MSDWIIKREEICRTSLREGLRKSAGALTHSLKEGTFLLCTFWLAHALALSGEVAGARKTFESAIAFANDVGLLSEEVDPATGELIGNYPQAFSHIGLINAAWAIAQIEENKTKQQPVQAG